MPLYCPWEDDCYLSLEDDFKQHPEDFAITKKEIQYLHRVIPIAERVRARYIRVEDGRGVLRLDDTAREAAEKAFKEKKLRPDTIRQLASRIIHKTKWFTYAQALHEGEDCAFLRTYNDEKGGIVTRQEFPDFYPARTVWEQRLALNLPVDYLYIFPYELEMIFDIAGLLGTDEGTDRSESGLLHHIATPVSTYTMPTTKLSADLPEMPFNTEVKMTISGQKKAAKSVICILEYENPNPLEAADANIKIIANHRFTAYDREVNDTIASMFAASGAGSVIATAPEIYRCMIGADDSATPSKNQIAKIIESINRQRRTFVKIDYTEQAKLYGKNVDRATLNAAAISAEEIELESGGKKLIGYHFLAPPPFYKYASEFNQVAAIPAHLRNIKAVTRGKIEQGAAAALSNTDTNILIRSFLLRRIEAIKGKNRFANKPILLDSLYKAIEKPSLSRTEAARIRKDIEAMLDYWAVCEYIKGYEFIKTGQRFTHIKITV